MALNLIEGQNLSNDWGPPHFVYADSETEPESATKATWVAPASASRPAWVNGAYVATQTEGYAQNLAIIGSRAVLAQATGRATMIAITGDLVESGGEQRNWDEFWRHNAGSRDVLASSTAIVPALLCPSGKPAISELSGNRDGISARRVLRVSSRRVYSKQTRGTQPVATHASRSR